MTRGMAGSLLLLLATSPATAAESAADVRAKLKGALTCQVDPLGALRKLAKAGSTAFDAGYAGHEYGEDLDLTSLVILRSPIVIGDAKTHAVMAGPSPVSGFSALVHARFTGDARKAAAELGLAPVEAGVFRKKLKIDSAGKPDDTCPMTIELKTLEKEQFLLGCGWCNG